MLFIALEHPYYIVIVATTFMDNVYKLHGFSAMIIIDRDPMFLSQFWKHLFGQWGVELHFSTAYHLQRRPSMMFL